jgi:uncharacterized protein YdaU (DUF1376 family)
LVAEKEKSPAFQFYPKDFLSSSKVGRMSLTEIGAYALLLSHSWLEGGLPIDIDEIAKLVKVPAPRFARMWAGSIGECFVQRGDRLINERLEVERVKQATNRQRATDNGRKGGRPKHLTQNNPTLSSGLSKPEAEKSFPIAIASPDVPPSGGTARGGTLVRPRRRDAEFEGARLYVPQRVHQDLMALANHPGGENALIHWYAEVDAEYQAHPEWRVNPDLITFWKGKYRDKWPPPDPAAKPRPVAADHPSNPQRVATGRQ